MKLIRLVTLSTLFACSLVCQAEIKTIPTTSKISKITLYRNQALTVRRVEVPADTGELALVVENLPESVDSGSLFASSNELKVRSVRYLTELIQDKQATDKISELEKELKKLAVEKEILKTKRKLLGTKESYVTRLEKQYISKLGSTATITSREHTDIKTSGFDFESIGKMTEFVFKQQEALTKEGLELDAAERKVDEAIRETRQSLEAIGFSTANRAVQQRANLAPSRKYKRKAIVYIAKTTPLKTTLDLSYLVRNAGWSPAYNMRIANGSNTLNLEYLAHVRQQTGEDWNGVKLLLSTATPNMNAEVPILAPMWVHLIDSDNYGNNFTERQNITNGLRQLGDLTNGNPLVQNVQSQIDISSKFKKVKGGNWKDYNYSLNSGAWERQNIEFSNRKETVKRWSEDVKKLQQQMAVEYEIPDTVTLASRNDNQMVQILSKPLKCKLYYEAVPLLASYVSRGIEAKNSIKQPLLAGKYSAFIDGQYVGTGQVPVTATGQTLVLGFGIDPQLRCRRELVDKTGGKSWGSRTEEYKYSIALDNYKEKPVIIRLIDRIPVTKDKGLTIALRDGKEQLSKDKDYLEQDLPKGILRWDITLAPATSGGNATKFNYSFDMKFDSDMRIAGQDNKIKERLRNDLQDMILRRQRK